MNSEISNGFIKVVVTCVVILLFLILGIVVYMLFKPPVVTKEAIDKLISSTQETQNYVKELRNLALENRNKTNEDNDLLRNKELERNESYEDLYEKYTIHELAKYDLKVNHSSWDWDDGYRLHLQTQSNGCEQFSHYPATTCVDAIISRSTYSF